MADNDPRIPPGRDKNYRRNPPEQPKKEADPDAETTYAKFVESARLLTTPGLLNSDGRMQRAARFLSGSDTGLIERAATDAGVEAADLMAAVERFEPGSVKKFALQKKGLSASSEGDRPWKDGQDDSRGPDGSPPSQFGDKGRSVKGKGKTEVDWDSKLRPTIQDALGSDEQALEPGMRGKIDDLRKTQASYPTGENIAREAARNRPLDSFSRAEQFLEDMDSVGNRPFERKTQGAPLAEGQEGPEEMPAPRATYTGEGTGRGVGPGGKAAGTQEDFNAYRTQKSIDEAVSERQRQKRISFLRAGGRMAADGKDIVVLPGSGPENRSGAFQYADELREEARLAENKRSKERSNKFRESAGEPATEFGREIAARGLEEEEAAQFLKTVKQQLRGAEKTARDVARGYGQVSSDRRERVGYAEGAGGFFDEVDDLRAVKSQLKGRDIKGQIEWAKDELNRRRKIQEDFARKEEERRRVVNEIQSNSFQGLVNMNRNSSRANIASGQWEGGY